MGRLIVMAMAMMALHSGAGAIRPQAAGSTGIAAYLQNAAAGHPAPAERPAAFGSAVPHAPSASIRVGT